MIGNAVKVMRIATGEETEEADSARSAAAELGSRGGKARLIYRWQNGEAYEVEIVDYH